MKYELDEFVLGAKNIKVYGRRVGYYHANGTIAFLIDAQCRLTQEEKIDVVNHIGVTLGLPVRGHWRNALNEVTEH